MPGKRQAGWPSLLVTFLLATQEKSDSVVEGDRPLLPLNGDKNKSITHRVCSCRSGRPTALLYATFSATRKSLDASFAGMTR